MATRPISKISSEVQQCLDQFVYLCNNTEHRNTQLEDQLGRFRVWAGNFAARGPAHSRKSLEYRLRDSTDLRKTVLSLLQDLQRALGDLGQALGLSRVIPEPDSDRIESPGATSEHSWRSESFTVSESDSDNSFDPGRAAAQEVHDVVDCLMRFSLALRRPAQQDLTRLQLSTSMTTFEPYYTERVAMLFPQTPSFIQQRLGKAMSANRQYLEYRETYHDRHKMDPKVSGQKQSVAAMPMQIIEAEQMTSTAMDAGELSEVSTASSTESDGGIEPLRFPQWPVKGVFGQPFVCPLCHGTIVARTRRSWRQHVLEDIPPYVCLELDCRSTSRPFARRRDWKHHTASHNKLWACPLSCSSTEVWPSIDSLVAHLRTEHDQVMRATALEACSRDGSHSLGTSSAKPCPICQQKDMIESVHYKHVCHHLEELAMLIVPAHLAESTKASISTHSVGRSTISGPSKEELPRTDADTGSSGPIAASSSMRGHEDAVGQDQYPGLFSVEQLIDSIVQKVINHYLIYIITQQVTAQVIKSLAGPQAQGQRMSADTGKQRDSVYLDRLITSTVDEAMREVRNHPRYLSLAWQSRSYTSTSQRSGYNRQSLAHPLKPVAHYGKHPRPDSSMDDCNRAASARADVEDYFTTGFSSDRLRKY